MGKKYIVKLGGCERLYKAFINGNGKPNLTWLSPEVDLTPYTEPDIEQVRKEAYERGYCDALEKHCEICEEKHDAEEAYQQGLNDAWECARKIVDCAIPYEALENYLEIGECTVDVIKHLPASKAIEIVRAYEQEQEEIKVGDEVKWNDTTGDVAVVTRIYEYKDYQEFDGIADSGEVYEQISVREVVKTGRHFSEIATVLAKMREA